MYQTPNMISQGDDFQGLWLTERFLKRLRLSAKWGSASVWAILLVSLSSGLFALYYLLSDWQKDTEGRDFYLLEGSNPYRALKLLSTTLPYGFVFYALFQGQKAWKLLHRCQTDDNALLEGTERLGKLFRWLVFASATFLIFKLLWAVW